MSDKSTAAIVLAAGQGKRMNSMVPKQYLSIQGRPVLYYTLKVFEESNVDHIIVVVGQGEVEYCQKHIIKKYGFNKVSNIIEGGQERFHSVYNGLCALKHAEYVMIHDGARPFLNVDIIERTIQNVIKYKACVVGMPTKDTIKIADDSNYVRSTPPRNKVWMIQTPQAFDYELIKKAYDDYINNYEIAVTDDAMVLELITKHPVKLVEGSYENIKITTPEDILIADAILKNNV